jgi:DHA2 family multidrug resistance protein-like MFS transporter
VDVQGHSLGYRAPARCTIGAVPTEPAPPAVPLYERPEVHDRRWFLLAVLCLSLVMVVMAVSGLNTALPRIQEDLGASPTVLQWILDAYALVFAGLLLMAGAIGDRFGRKGALLIGLVVFGAGSLISGLASSSAQVIVGRAVSGVGAALLMPATLSLITAIFPPDERTRAIAVWVGFAGAGGAIGPVVSGALLDHFWWGSAFLANLPVVAIAAVAIATFSPRSRDDAATPLDPRGAVLSLVGIAALLFGIIEGPERGWTDVVVLATFVVAVVFIVGFGLWERRAPHPMLPMSFFADRRFSVGSAVVMTTFGLLFGFFFSFTLYLQFARGYSPLDAGLAGLPSAVALVLVSSRSAGITERLGSGRAIALGFALIGIGMAVFTQIGVETPYLVLVLGMVCFSSGASMAMAPATGNIMSAVPPAKAGVGSAVNDTTRELGGALGIAVFGSIVNSAYRGGIDLGDLGLAAAQVHSAEQSIGAATGIGAQIGGEQGGAVLERAASAFTDAFNTGMIVSAAIAFAAAATVLRTLSASREHAAAAAAAAADPEVELRRPPGRSTATR